MTLVTVTHTNTYTVPDTSLTLSEQQRLSQTTWHELCTDATRLMMKRVSLKRRQRPCARAGHRRSGVAIQCTCTVVELRSEHMSSCGLRASVVVFHD